MSNPSSNSDHPRLLSFLLDGWDVLGDRVTVSLTGGVAVTYTFGENLILSTHSPQVVAWTSPDKVNLVHRNNGKTFIQKLNADEIHRVYNYLDEEGDLGEWVYSGILDE